MAALAGCSKEDSPAELITITDVRAVINLDRAADAAEVAASIVDADALGVTHYVLKGEFAKLGIKQDPASPVSGVMLNPFRGTNVEFIDFRGVTDWPKVLIKIDGKSVYYKGFPELSFEDAGAMIGDPYYPDLQYVLFPKEVVALGFRAFMFVGSLIKVSAPGVTVVDNMAFAACEALSEIDLPAITTIKASAFGYCTSLTHVYWPKVSSVEGSAFSDCHALSEVDLPKITVVDYNTFRNCSSLERINLPKVTKFGHLALDGCTSLALLKLTTSEVLEIGQFDFDDLQTEKCSLVLNSNKKGEVVGKKWRNLVWKSITFE